MNFLRSLWLVGVLVLVRTLFIINYLLIFEVNKMFLKLKNTYSGHRLVTIYCENKRTFIPLVSGDELHIDIPDSASFHVSPALSLEEASSLLARRRRSSK